MFLDYHPAQVPGSDGEILIEHLFSPNPGISSESYSSKLVAQSLML